MPRTSQEDHGEGDRREDHGSGSLPDHVIDDLLASERRRTMLEILAERSAPVVLDDLVRATLAEEQGTIPSEISQEECRAARIEAYEKHLPKLTAVDVVEYDSLVGTLKLTDESVLERLDASA